MWLQSFVDGKETARAEVSKPSLELEIVYTDFVRLMSGIVPIHELRVPPVANGSVAALSALGYLLEQPDWLRARRFVPATVHASEAGYFEGLA